MDQLRRTFLKSAGVAGSVVVAISAGLLKSGEALAASAWNTNAFSSKTIADALTASGYTGSVESKDIDIKAPEIAENGQVVPVEVVSKIAGTTSIAIFVEKNPTPMVGSFDLMAGAEPFISTRIKMGQTSLVRVVVKAGGKTFSATKEVKVTIGGCGG
jgi:sulfur-oxidizing protein SoxY